MVLKHRAAWFSGNSNVFGTFSEAKDLSETPKTRGNRDQVSFYIEMQLIFHKTAALRSVLSRENLIMTYDELIKFTYERLLSKDIVLKLQHTHCKVTIFIKHNEGFRISLMHVDLDFWYNVLLPEKEHHTRN